ncbi:hypothetical protein DEO72_LG11g1529 [Vigna unguiculata]|uniref:Uncharacterized protein n=1 Tax=Vigna unguiculata TaxID=3917 RepID=A0A4D6NMG6_VIGUN|nr:hypothetical protein DEO72_LG11g1529 [Vigna unguiculata]
MSFTHFTLLARVYTFPSIAVRTLVRNGDSLSFSVCFLTAALDIRFWPLRVYQTSEKPERIEPNFHFAAFSLAFCEIQSVEHRLGKVSGDYSDGGASSSGIQSHSFLGVSQDKYSYLISVISSSMFDSRLVHVLIASLIHCVKSMLKFFRVEIDSKYLF